MLSLIVMNGCFPKHICRDLCCKTDLFIMMIFCFSCLFCTMSKLNVLFFGGRTRDYPVHPSTFEIPLPPPLCLHTHTNSESMKQPFATNPFVFTPPFPLNNVPKPNPQASSTNQGHLLATKPLSSQKANKP